jgi:hypothetical protein
MAQRPEIDLRDGFDVEEKRREHIRGVFKATFVRGIIIIYGLAAIDAPVRYGWRIFTDTDIQIRLIGEIIIIPGIALLIAYCTAVKEDAKSR